MERSDIRNPWTWFAFVMAAYALVAFFIAIHTRHQLVDAERHASEWQGLYWQCANQPAPDPYAACAPINAKP